MYNELLWGCQTAIEPLEIARRPLSDRQRNDLRYCIAMQVPDAFAQRPEGPLHERHWRPKAAILPSRSLNFWTLPLEVMGYSCINRTYLGILKLAILP